MRPMGTEEARESLGIGFFGEKQIVDAGLFCFDIFITRGAKRH